MTVAPAGTTTGPTGREGRRPLTERIADRVNWVMATQLLAAIGAFSLPARPEVINGVFLGTLVGVALAPLWLATLYRYRGAVGLLVFFILSLLGGWTLSFLNPGERQFDRALGQSTSGMLIVLFLAFAVFLWARTVLGPTWTSVWAGLGMVVGGLLQPSGVGAPWKYDIGIPITVIVLALAARRGPRPVVEVPLAIVMAGMFAVNDARSLFAIVVLAAVTCVVQAMLSKGASGIRSLLLPLGLLGVAGLGAYRVMSWGIEQGWLGEAARLRQMTQMEQSGNVLTSGRPEMGASIELLSQQPWGIGNALYASRTDITHATEGMAAVSDRLPDPGYLTDYMFRFGFTMHSFGAEHWLRYGIPGLALVLLFAGLTIAGLLRLLAHRRLTVVVTFLALNTLWNLLFSPTLDTTFPLALSTALILAPLTHSDSDEYDRFTRVGSPWHRLATLPHEQPRLATADLGTDLPDPATATATADSTPQGAADSTPQGTAQSTPQGAADSTPQGTGEPKDAGESPVPARNTGPVYYPSRRARRLAEQEGEE